MLSNKEGVSVIIPTIRKNKLAFDSINSVVISLKNFKKKKELILCVDRQLEDSDMVLFFTKRYSFVRLFVNEETKGSAYTRNLGIQKSRYGVLLFTDDDCLVPREWVEKLYEGVTKSGICAGLLAARDQYNLISRLEELTDYYRIRSRDASGNIKWLSFPNLGIRKGLLPVTPFSTDRNDTVEDMSLACRLRLNGLKITLDNELTVGVEYPRSLNAVIARKIKHARGIAFLNKRLTFAMRNYLSIETNAETLKRWLRHTLESDLKVYEKAIFSLMNITYCLGLFYFTKKFSEVFSLSREELAI